MPSEKSVKRGRGRPHGVKDRKRRRFRPRMAVPLEQQVLSKREAAAVAGVGLSKIDQNLKAIGAVRSGARILIFRDHLMAWVQSLPPAVPTRSATRERAAGGAPERAGPPPPDRKRSVAHALADRPDRAPNELQERSSE
jgi:hypothetical protein